MLGMVSYYCAIVTLSLKRAGFHIFDLKNAVTLKTGLWVREGHWKYHHAIETFYRCSSNYGSISCRLSQKRQEIEPQLLVSFLRHSISKNIATLTSRWRISQGHWKWYHSTDYVWFPIVFYSNFFNQSLRPLRSLSFWDIQLVNIVTLKSGLGITQGHRNRNVYRSAAYDFLLTFDSNDGLISYHFRDKRRFQSKIAKFFFSLQCILRSRWRGSP